jgi:hypothetical protein
MVTFFCDGCQGSIKKPQIAKHVHQCRFASTFSCIDCGKDFNCTTVQQHTACVSEAQKYGHNKGIVRNGPQTVSGQKRDQPSAEPVPSTVAQKSAEVVAVPAAKKAKKVSKALSDALPAGKPVSLEEAMKLIAQDIEVKEEKKLRKQIVKALLKDKSGFSLSITRKS